MSARALSARTTTVVGLIVLLACLAVGQMAVNDGPSLSTDAAVDSTAAAARLVSATVAPPPSPTSPPAPAATAPLRPREQAGVPGPSVALLLGTAVVDLAERTGLLAASAAQTFDVSLDPGAEGPAVVAVQEHLVELGFDPGPIDGRLGDGTLGAIWALQKLAGQEPSDRIDRSVVELLAAPVLPRPATAASTTNRVEVDLTRQILVVWSPADEVVRISHVSTGSGEYFCVPGTDRCGRARTRPGSFTITRRIDGWRHAALGGLYNPLYFNGGIAIHGSGFVPTWPDSHGCVRVPMHVAEELPDLLENGATVTVLDEPVPVSS